MIEKLLMRFKFYRKRLAAMNEARTRLLDLQASYTALVETYHLEARKHLETRGRLRDLGEIVLAYERYATPFARMEGEKAGEGHIEAFHGIPRLGFMLNETMPQIPELRIAWAKGFRSKFKGEVAE